MQGVIRLARELQPLACRIIEQGFTFCGSDPAELQECGHIFSAHFRVRTTDQRQGAPESGAGLETLAAAATELQSHGTCTSTRSERRDSAMVPSLQQAEHARVSQSAEPLSNIVTGLIIHSESRTNCSYAPVGLQLDPDFSHLRGYDSNAPEAITAIDSTPTRR